MEIKWVEDFLALAHTLNFSKAADERHVTQSAFSRRIKQLETWLGTTLIDRATYPSRLTEDGEKFIPVAQETLRSLYQIRQGFQAHQNMDAQTISFIALHTLSFTFFPQWLRRIQDLQYPVFSRLRPDSGSVEGNVNALVDGDCDFLLTYVHPSVPLLLNNSDFDYKVIGYEQIIPVSAPDAEGKPLHCVNDEEKPFDYIGYEKSSFFGHLLGELFARKMPEHRLVHEGSMSISLKGMAMSGWGMAWVPSSLIADELAAGQLVPGADPSWNIQVEIRLYCARNNQRGAVRRLWNRLEELNAVTDN
ncbi:LysR family transcriptional regulator [Pseudochrobactrum sp. HB0163]|uniref:LysR family transcriptional regulator n=1 Tax=Pseudochrobactrum sp. HB0163 TaxID=3450708 RepID=UPI003F6E0444